MPVRALLILGLAAVLSACTTHIPIRTQIDINAPPERVFAALSDFQRYPEWNPYHIRVAGDAEIGAPLDVRVRRPDGKVIDVPQVHVLRLSPNRELTWGGGVKGVFYGEHVFALESTASGTRLVHNEDFRGLFIGFADLPPDVLTEGYRLMNVALKAYIEGG